MRTNVQSRIAAFSADVEKFAVRWHQLKPSSYELDGDKETCLKAVHIIKDKRQEFSELDDAKSKLMCVVVFGYISTDYWFYLLLFCLFTFSFFFSIRTSIR